MAKALDKGASGYSSDYADDGYFGWCSWWVRVRIHQCTGKDMGTWNGNGWEKQYPSLVRSSPQVGYLAGWRGGTTTNHIAVIEHIDADGTQWYSQNRNQDGSWWVSKNGNLHYTGIDRAPDYYVDVGIVFDGQPTPTPTPGPTPSPSSPQDGEQEWGYNGYWQYMYIDVPRTDCADQKNPSFPDPVSIAGNDTATWVEQRRYTQERTVAYSGFQGYWLDWIDKYNDWVFDFELDPSDQEA